MTGRPASRWPRAVLIAIHAPVIAIAVTFTILSNRHDLTVGDVLAPIVAGGLVGALQLRHSLAAARGVRPRAALWTLGALAVFVYLPLPSFGINWGITQTMVLASALMLLPGRSRVVAPRRWCSPPPRTPPASNGAPARWAGPCTTSAARRSSTRSSAWPSTGRPGWSGYARSSTREDRTGHAGGRTRAAACIPRPA